MFLENFMKIMDKVFSYDFWRNSKKILKNIQRNFLKICEIFCENKNKNSTNFE